MRDQPSTDRPSTDSEQASVQAILDALRGLRFGSVTVVVQDGVIVQIERVEKKRLASSARKDH